MKNIDTTIEMATNMKETIWNLLHQYKTSPENITMYRSAPSYLCKISIETGMNEGYFVNVQKGNDVAFCRYHSKDEVLTALGVLLTLLPNH